MCEYISITFIAFSITNKRLLKITLMSMMTKYKDFDFTLFVKLNKETTISTRINSYYSNSRAPLYIHYIISIIFLKRKVKLQINALLRKRNSAQLLKSLRGDIHETQTICKISNLLLT